MCPPELICATKATVGILMLAAMLGLGVAISNLVRAWEEHNAKKKSGK